MKSRSRQLTRQPLKALLVCILVLSAPLGVADEGCPLAKDAIAGTPDIASGGMSTHLRDWLDVNGYGDWRFSRDEIEGGSYGGRQSPDEEPRQQPVVFVHGNSDRASTRA